MNVLVDTAVWSLAFRRKAPDHPVVDVLRRLIVGGRALLIGPIRQELLSGIRERAAFERLREGLRAFPDLPLAVADYERAAACFNECRAAGVQGSNTDFLICAVAERHRIPILTTDADFREFARVLPVRLVDFGGQQA
jgi:predicted nucleic acid-binding protein